MTQLIITRNGRNTVLQKAVVKNKGEAIPFLPFKVFFGDVQFVVERIDESVCIVHEYHQYSFSKVRSRHYTYTVGAGDTLILADVGDMEPSGE